VPNNIGTSVGRVNSTIYAWVAYKLEDRIPRRKSIWWESADRLAWLLDSWCGDGSG